MMSTNSTENLNKQNSAGVLCLAILSYSNPLHHPVQGNDLMRMHAGNPINYRSEIEPDKDQRIRGDIQKIQNHGKQHEDEGKEDPREDDGTGASAENPSKEDENIHVPDTEEGDDAVPDTEDPNEAKQDVRK